MNQHSNGNPPNIFRHLTKIGPIAFLMFIIALGFARPYLTSGNIVTPQETSLLSTGVYIFYASAFLSLFGLLLSLYALISFPTLKRVSIKSLAYIAVVLCLEIFLVVMIS